MWIADTFTAFQIFFKEKKKKKKKDCPQMHLLWKGLNSLMHTEELPNF